MKTSTFSLAAAVVLALGACGSGDSEPAEPKTVTETASADSADDGAADTAEGESGAGTVEGEGGVVYYDEGVEAVIEYGNTYTWPSGLSINVEEAGAYKSGTQYKATMKNGTGKPYDVSMPGVSVECDAEELEPFYEDGAPERPAITLMPGKSKTWTEAWDGSGDCMYWIQPDMDEESVYFVSEDYADMDDGR